MTSFSLRDENKKAREEISERAFELLLTVLSGFHDDRADQSILTLHKLDRNAVEAIHKIWYIGSLS